MPDDGLTLRAACFFVLAEQASRLGGWSDKSFWELSALPVVETAPHLPAMTAAVRNIVVRDGPEMSILEAVASQPLPAVLPPEAVRWHNRLIAAWEVHRASSDEQLENLAQLALVRLDGCGMPDGHERPSRLPEWLAEARKIASGEWGVANGRSPYWEMNALAALATWRPAPRVVTPPETLRAWVDFWLEMRKSRNPMKKGVASIALLNLPEAWLRAASVAPLPAVEPFHEEVIYLPLSVLMSDWQIVTERTWTVTEMRKVAHTWLEATRHKECFDRYVAWRQLIRWDRAGRLALCGIDLLPELVQAVATEADEGVLWQMAQWAPSAERFTATGTPDGRFLLRQLESVWKRHRTSGNLWTEVPAWLAGIRLHQAGLASESPESFLDAYLSHLAREWNSRVLFTFAQWSPGADAPERWYRDWHKIWQERLLDEHEPIRKVATWALLRQFLEREHGRSLRGAALERWRAGAKVSPEARPILGAAFSRFQEVRARLVAGEVPDFEWRSSQPAERCRPPLALPPGRIAGGEWNMENEN